MGLPKKRWFLVRVGVPGAGLGLGPRSVCGFGGGGGAMGIVAEQEGHCEWDGGGVSKGGGVTNKYQSQGFSIMH